MENKTYSAHTKKGNYFNEKELTYSTQRQKVKAGPMQNGMIVFFSGFISYCPLLHES
jgi:hypothetical protein